MNGIRTRAGIAPNKPEVNNLGSLRAHIYNYALAKSLQGSFVLRFDNTNPEIHHVEFIPTVEAQLHRLGFRPDFASAAAPDGLPAIQSERTIVYRAWLERLLDSSYAYRVAGTQAVKIDLAKYRETWGDTIAWCDMVLGTVKIQIVGWHDYFVCRSDASALYHLASVVDDHVMGITHSLRGQDKVSSLPFQLILARILDLAPVSYGHMPLLLGEDGRRLSTRKGDPSFSSLRKAGFAEPAILSYLCSSGYGAPETIYPALATFVAGFQLGGLHRSCSRIDMQRLCSTNRRMLQRMPDDPYLILARAYLAERGQDEAGPSFARLLLAFKPRINSFADLSAALEVLRSPTYELVADAEVVAAVTAVLNSALDRTPASLEEILDRATGSRTAACHALRWILTGQTSGCNLEVLVRYFLDAGRYEDRVVRARAALAAAGHLTTIQR
ncbi:MAG: glutamate--tRNA ligase family protein [Thermoanaerobaculaceae bacterium]